MRKKYFRFDPVLPLVFDDSLTYYEAICKLAKQVDLMGDQIDEGLVEFIKEALPELIADAVYDSTTGTLEITLIDDVTEDQTLDEPIKRIAVNGLSRPVYDETARTMLNASWLYGKNICMYGDSTLFVAESYYYELLNSGIINSITRRGASGTTLTTAGLQLINDANDLSTFDYVFVCYGINDWSGIARNRWTAAVKAAAERIINAGSEPVFVFPWVVYIPTTASGGFINNYGCDMRGYVDAAIEQCQALNVKYFNLCALSGVNQRNYSRMLTPSSNGYYLHEGVELAKLIATAILSGNYCTGQGTSENFIKNGFKTLLPNNFGYDNYTNTRTLVGNSPSNFRKGKIVTLDSGKVCRFKAISSGRCRITGIMHHSDANGYITIGAISGYDQSETFVPFCRINNNSDFDFIITPPNDGDDWEVGIEASNGSAVIYDLTIYGNNGTPKLVTRIAPNDPATPISYHENVSSIIYQGYEYSVGDNVKLTGHSVRLGSDFAAGQNVNIGNLDFYPQRSIFGTCHIGSAAQLFRITQTGAIQLYVLGSNYTANTAIVFDECDITPNNFFMPA